MIRFDSEPQDEELLSPVGLGELASSTTHVIDEPHQFRISPGDGPPLWFAKIIMPLVGLGGIIACWYTLEGLLKWVAMIIWGLMSAFSTTQFISLVEWFSELQGTEDYIIVAHQSGQVSLPRVELAFSNKSVAKLVVVRFADKLTQVSLVIEDETAAATGGPWIHAWVYNLIGREGKDPGTLANALGVELQRIEVDSKRAAKLLE
jgi:hypothetical protein